MRRRRRGHRRLAGGAELERLGARRDEAVERGLAQSRARPSRGGRGPRAPRRAARASAARCSSATASPDGAAHSTPMAHEDASRSLGASRRSRRSRRGTGSATSSTGAGADRTASRDASTAGAGCARCSTSSARRSSSSASCSRRGPTSSRRTSSPSCAGSRTTSRRSRSSEVARRRRGGARPHDRAGVPRVRRAPIASASIGQVHRARPARRRRRSSVKVQRPARRARSRPTSGCSTRRRGSLRERVRRSSSSTRGARRRVRALDPPRARLRARGAERGDLPPELRAATSASSCRASSGGTRRARLLTLECLRGHAGRATSTSSRWRPTSGATSRTACGRLDDDGLPARLLPRRPAPGEHLRPRRRAARPRRLRPGGKLTDDDMAKLTRLFVDAATENVERDPAAAPRARRALPARPRGGVPRASSRSSSTATTARGSPTSTRSR